MLKFVIQVQISLNPLNMLNTSLCVCFTWTRAQTYYDITDIARQQDGARAFYISQVRNILKSHYLETIGRRFSVTVPSPLMWSHAVWLFDAGMINNVSSRRAEVLRAPTNDRWGRIWESGLGQKFMSSIVNSVAERCPRCIERVRDIGNGCNTTILNKFLCVSFFFFFR